MAHGSHRTRTAHLAGMSAVVTLLLAAAACESDRNAVELDQLARSRQSWAALKASPSRHYRYVDSDASFTGARWQTTVEVRSDTVIRRAYSREDRSGASLESWSEEGASVGTHSAGAAPLTLEQVYDGCASTVLNKDTRLNLITLTFSSNGVLGTCTYFPKNCADDCAIGYRITALDLLDP